MKNKTQSISEIFTKYNFPLARMISGSKSAYREKYPKNEIFFNANIFIENLGKIWYGDLDITKDKDDLNKIAAQIGVKLYVVREMDGRFGVETKSIEEIIKNAVWTSK